MLPNVDLKEKIKYIHDYMLSSNAATASKVDANSNVTQKTIAGLEAELFKPDTIQINRKLVKDKLTQMFGEDMAKAYEDDLSNHYIYTHDETSLKPYCASITLYPFLLEGTKCLGGVSKAPKNLQSFCGSFVNLVYQIASNFSGAIATVEFLHMFDYFARKQWGKEYLAAHHKEVEQEFQGVVYALNQPASARGDQSVFWNISIFDHDYLKEMFGGFYYPDGTQVDIESTYHLQKFFLSWFRQEREKELLTFPVVTAALLTEGVGGFKDTKFVQGLVEEQAKGLSFFVYMSDRVDSLASCCRLRNELADNTFSYTLGAGGVVTGSARVISLNINRIGQCGVMLDEVVDRVHKYLLAQREVLKGYIDAGLLPAYTQGFMDIDKQFLTIGVNGVLEYFEYLRDKLGVVTEEEYPTYLKRLLEFLSVSNKIALSEYGVRFNTEFVPAENLGVKNAKWDNEAGLYVTRDCYNSYFYPVEDTKVNVLDKLKLYSKDIVQYLDGGSALHLNLEQMLSQEQFMHLYKLCSMYGVQYWTTNVLCTICNNCGYINTDTENHCVKCGSTDVDYGTRVIGYLKRISNFSEARQKEAGKRFYHHLKK
ncbi:anaerobic ribonucleoside-triphosphate reductase [uncultured Megasphaera sp.]|uniref:anaerobic ribonucleoside-triphosphate reductase n=1 Tax=uncultured Megasphaera sp. TaxID=165188 RepID=UPI0025955943|nr:anaerobic ribonucleoside-triphosphate reductase [uncultured Megasphaera sp.]